MSDIHQNSKHGKNVNVSGDGNTVSGGDMTEHRVTITGGQFGTLHNFGSQTVNFSSTDDADNVNVQGSGNRVAGGHMSTTHISGRVSGANVNIGGSQVLHGTTHVNGTSINVSGDGITTSAMNGKWLIELRHAKTGAILESKALAAESFEDAYTAAKSIIESEYTTRTGVALAVLTQISKL